MLVHTVVKGEVVCAQHTLRVRPQLMNSLSISTSADEVKPGNNNSQ